MKNKSDVNISEKSQTSKVEQASILFTKIDDSKLQAISGGHHKIIWRGVVLGDGCHQERGNC